MSETGRTYPSVEEAANAVKAAKKQFYVVFGICCVILVCFGILFYSICSQL